MMVISWQAINRGVNWQPTYTLGDCGGLLWETGLVPVPMFRHPPPAAVIVNAPISEALAKRGTASPRRLYSFRGNASQVTDWQRGSEPCSPPLFPVGTSSEGHFICSPFLEEITSSLAFFPLYYFVLSSFSRSTPERTPQITYRKISVSGSMEENLSLFR